MRSEKEIKERLKLHKENQGNNPLADLSLIGKEGELEWVLEGESRYSVSEIEKIINWCVKNEGFGPPMEEWILETIKDKKKMQEILQ